MDIKQAERIAQEHGGQLLGYHTVPLPVYQVFVNYETFDDNPFFPIQKALLQWVYEREDNDDGKHENIQFVSSLLGIDYHLVQQVFNELKREHYVNVAPDTNRYSITEEARLKFIMPNSRPSKRVTGSVILDGKSFDFFPKDAYAPILEEEVYLRSNMYSQNVEVHKPIDMSADSHSPEIAKLESALNNHKIRLEDIGLRHKEGKNFKVTQIEKKFISPVYVVYVGMKDGDVVKLPYIGKVLLRTPALADTDKFTFSVKRVDGKMLIGANLGYNANEETTHEYVTTNADNFSAISEIVRDRYKIKANTDIDISKSGCYLQIEVTEEMLKQSSLPEKLLDDCSCINFLTGEETPRCVLRLGSKSNQGILIIKINQHIPKYIELNNVLKNHVTSDKLEGRLYAIASDWRRKLIIMRRNLVLEELDCDKYIHPFT